MRKIRAYSLSLILLVSFLMSACTSGSGNGLAEPTQLDAENAQKVAERFLDNWKSSDYDEMYDLISPSAQEAYTEETFINIYDVQVAQPLAIKELSYNIVGTTLQGTTALVSYTVTFETDLMGKFTDPAEDGATRTMRLIGTREGWRIAWSRMDIFDGWTSSSDLTLERTMPTRGNIYDRNGKVMVQQGGTARQLYVSQNTTASIDGCIRALIPILRRDYDSLEAEFYNGRTPENIFIIGEISEETYNTHRAEIDGYCSPADVGTRTTRFYYDRVAPHVIGYIGHIPANEQDEFVSKGYPIDALVGLTGIEFAFESQLAGTIGVKLVIRSDSGTRLRTIAEQAPVQGNDLYLTLDRDLQLAVQELFAQAYTYGRPTWATHAPGGAAVVMNVKTGEILAMHSYPDYDPSIFNPDTLILNPQELIEEYSSGDVRRPLFNRAIQGRYPLGSVFKIFTMVVALDSGVWTPDRTVVCNGIWDGTGFGDRSRNDWQKPPGHGEMNMHSALVNSCNPYFWTIGAILNQYDPNILPHGIQAFGFGSAPALQGIATNDGFILDPESKPVVRGTEWSISDAVNMAIGQDVVGINPLQVVMAVAAVANNGTLYDPLIVSRVELNGEIKTTYAPKGKELPFNKQVLQQTRDAMCDVTTVAQSDEQDMNYGTATFMFDEWQSLVAQMGTPITICAKTGTAESGSQHPHAWFGAYSPAEDPEIAIVVVVENSCEGSEVAAPITRRILERYYGVEPNYGWPSLWDTGCTPIGPETAGP